MSKNPNQKKRTKKKPSAAEASKKKKGADTREEDLATTHRRISDAAHTQLEMAEPDLLRKKGEKTLVSHIGPTESKHITWEPLTIKKALDAQEEQNTGITDPRAALRNEAAKRAMEAKQEERPSRLFK
tara:strand:+ start:1193 stop:1576 length:384 start_codon:yes stop_codon:yes gene_type:complete